MRCKMASNPGKPAAVLKVEGGSNDGQTIALGREMTSIGRAAGNDIVVDDSNVSRRHAGIRRDEMGYWIGDLGSKNGTWVNGTSLGDEPQRLRHTDRIQVGGTDGEVAWVFTESRATMGMPAIGSTAQPGDESAP